MDTDPRIEQWRSYSWQHVAQLALLTIIVVPAAVFLAAQAPLGLAIILPLYFIAVAVIGRALHELRRAYRDALDEQKDH